MTRTAQASKWFQCAYPKPQAEQRLFCFHYAGGGASAFNQWGKDLPDSIEVVAVQLPGRESRLFEPVFTSLQPLVEAVAAEMLPFLQEKPFVFFGHSMGAIVSYEMSRYLKQQHGIQPSHLFVSGYPGPHTYQNDDPYYVKSDADLIQDLVELGGTPQELLENEELMRLVLPTIRADFQVCDTYEFVEGALLDCPLTAFGGWQDEMLTEEGMKAWGELTSGAFAMEMFEGDHFYLLETEKRDTILSHIKNCGVSK
ncbi:medium-chain acyl-[acyl-carrier-protein] hydrolase [Tumebacillus sp. BK434]|uniref:thioesterase II family protein n=1 Tax=Tumebacillus sp. BK434 TaxID=2512169 RepID=UPI0010432DA8|nr:alpha/beta fold hydrolase [Tumebacillus sp. BK434]TCP59057.1 medium-chain acyl-[acyl-carrier-protein] hydrolase [Tumebacillus sp. BK434]